MVSHSLFNSKFMISLNNLRYHDLINDISNSISDISNSISDISNYLMISEII